MAKRTINIDKITQVDLELLEEAAETILRELGRRHDQILDDLADQTHPYPQKEKYAQERADHFHEVKDLYLKRPEYVKWHH